MLPVPRVLPAAEAAEAAASAEAEAAACTQAAAAFPTEAAAEGAFKRLRADTAPYCALLGSGKSCFFSSA